VEIRRSGGGVRKVEAVRAATLARMSTPVENGRPETAPDDGEARCDNDDLAERLRALTVELEEIIEDPSRLKALPEDERARLRIAAGDVFNPDSAQRRRARKRAKRVEKRARKDRNESVLAETGIRVLRERPVFVTPNVYPPAGFEQADVEVEIGDDESSRQAMEEQHCYVCKQLYLDLHPFYDQLCPPCAAFNFAKRTETADLSGRVALLTGGRVKIGYQAGIKLLRAGARLIVTTRFPRDAAERYAAETDFAEWGDRLEIYGLDLRHTPSVEAFCHHLLQTTDRLDFIVNNACQTVRRPPDFYRHMLELETAAEHSLPAHARRLLGPYEGLRRYDMLPEGETALVAAGEESLVGITRAAELSQIALLPEDEPGQHDLFPEGRLDQDLQQIDLRERNSWRLLLAEVPTVELLETQLVNAVAPFVLNARLKPLMTRTPERDKHIVNVSAVEGQFYRRFKTTRHPHTNMAKAALNMMTRTSAADYHGDGIHMNSVDTGWVTDEDPAHLAERKATEHRFSPPLDIVDGAARIVDPIIDGINTGKHVWGVFLKDYRAIPW
jgi:NAD(P)-dependent dehydrogenase (short-subunit alcohol dehydrogenase family)